MGDKKTGSSFRLSVEESDSFPSWGENTPNYILGEGKFHGGGEPRNEFRGKESSGEGKRIETQHGREKT